MKKTIEKDYSIAFDIKRFIKITANTVGSFFIIILLFVSYLKENPYDYFKGLDPESVSNIISTKPTCENIKARFSDYKLECSFVEKNTNNVNLSNFKGNKDILIKTIKDIISKKEKTVFNYRDPSSKYIFINLLKDDDYFVVVYSNDNKTLRLMDEFLKKTFVFLF